ncbi:hypothetical protein ACXJJ3_08740 [Kribbella sp. WER1]|uniref:hypothetical protein n=1 Tax=Kribbella sp. NPDC059898 TaxID=3346995 RepID=UPI00364BF344
MPLSQADATARAEAEVRAYCGWHIAPQREDTLTLDGPGGPLLVLPSLHVVSVASVAENGTELDPEGYAWSAAGVLRRTSSATSWHGWNCGWTDDFRGLVVTLTHGYESMPLDVQTVIDRLASRSVDDPSQYSQVGQVAYATGADGLPVSGSLTALDRLVLDRYKIPPRP